MTSIGVGSMALGVGDGLLTGIVAGLVAIAMGLIKEEKD